MSSPKNWAYRVSPFDYDCVTGEQGADIGRVYEHCFRHDLDLVFDPLLDADFVDPCKYYSESSQGAFFVISKYCDAAYDADDESIVGTVGVRNFQFDPHQWPDFVSGVNPASKEFAFLSSCRTVTTDEAEGAHISVGGNSRALRVCEIKRMFFLPECRGKQLGKELLGVSLQWARDAGYDVCVLDTKRRLEAANHVYEKYGGFVDCGSYNGNPRADRFMCKLLK